MKELTTINSVVKTEKAIQEKHRIASAGRTPATQIKRRPDGFDFVEEAYMRKKLNDIYPIWSWEIDDTEFLGAEWIMVRGTLTILDNGVTRKFGAAGAKRIQFKRGTEHLPANIVDIGNNVKAANADAFKVATNRLCNIADDVYRKQVELPKPLTDKQQKIVADLLKEIDDHSLSAKVTLQVDSEKINSVNFKSAVDKLNQMKERKQENE